MGAIIFQATRMVGPWSRLQGYPSVAIANTSPNAEHSEAHSAFSTEAVAILVVPLLDLNSQIVIQAISQVLPFPVPCSALVGMTAVASTNSIGICSSEKDGVANSGSSGYFKWWRFQGGI